MSGENDRVSVYTGSGFYTEVSASGHTLVADEPTGAGGTDAGPTPYGYLLGALGSCTAMTVRLYADRKSWPLQAVKVSLKHGRVYAEDCADCETESGKIDRIELDLELEGPLDDSQREKLFEIADKCPVHRTLTSETVIETSTAART